MTKEELKQEALKHSEPKSIIDLIDEAYQAGQESVTEELQNSYISEESDICICNKEVERIINLINSKE